MVMIRVEGYKAFRGTMEITPKDSRFPSVRITGDWLYKPDTGCWYCKGSSYCDEICRVVEDET